EVARLVHADASEGVVITGGEPLMQSEAVVALIDAIRAHDPAARVEIETNGTIPPSPALAERVDLFMVSPKLSHSGNETAVALNVKALSAFAALESAVFKIVARTPGDVGAAAGLARELGLDPKRVTIMPEGATSEALRERAAVLIDTILAHGFCY